MASVVQTNFRLRKNLGRVRPIVEVPNLIDIQKSSYDKFLQANKSPHEREEVGLQAVFRSVFPIKDFNGTSELVFVSYNLEKPKYDVEECRQRGMTFAAPIKVTTQLMIYDTKDGGERIVRDIKEQEVYFGEIPLMTSTGTFIINGTERVVVSQDSRLSPARKTSSSAPSTSIGRGQKQTWTEVPALSSSRQEADHSNVNIPIRAVGELMENQYRIGLVRMERTIKERMSMSQEINTLMPHDLINAKTVSKSLGSPLLLRLSQLLDQTNPLSEMSHKRSVDIKNETLEKMIDSSGWKICPIDIHVNGEFFRASFPVNTRIEVLCQDSLRDVSRFSSSGDVGRYAAPVDGDPTTNVFSVSASLVPFAEKNLPRFVSSGVSSIRQAVPLVRTEAPYVGTGIEGRIAVDSGLCVVATRDGVVESVDANRIVIRADGDNVEIPDIYPLMKYQRSNQSTCYNQKPIVRAGDHVKTNDVLADGPAMDMGELALGRNVIVAFMPWQGYNYEDSILVSERIAKEDVFSSIHIEEFECVARDTRLGKEEITRDIPNVGEEATEDLDASGIVRIGVEVKPGDILVGKTTPKGETQLSPEEKLLRSIFGEKAGDVRDSSLKVPPGVSGIVINARVFSRKGTEKDDRAKEIEDQEKIRLERTMEEEKKILRDSFFRQIRKAFIGQTIEARLVDDKGKVLLQKNAAITEEILDTIPQKYWSEIEVPHRECVEKKIKDIEALIGEREAHFREKIDRLSKGDELPPGVIKMVKVYIAIKRKLQVGDKMAGRHGNKGVVSRIIAEEDLPYLADGTPVDLVLNPLGVPSRMNVGQILEVHLGWGARLIGRQIDAMIERGDHVKALRERMKQVLDGDAHFAGFVDKLDDSDAMRLAQKMRTGVFFASPVFDGAPEEAIKDVFDSVGVSRTGQSILFDGRTGDPFDQDVTVGIMYMLKLHHLVDDKIHARSIGPYSLVTQQPLGGKAQFGGQRLGEMEVWAMEAYGAAYALQEFLTVKSDDVQGRTRMYESIIKGDYALEAGIPESFNMFVKELQSLCLNIELIEGPGAGEAATGELAEETTEKHHARHLQLL